METARLVIAEVDPGLPRTAGDSRVHLSEIGRLVAAGDPTPYYPGPPRADPRAGAIAGHVAGLIPDGATVQLGPGSVTGAAGELLGGPRLMEWADRNSRVEMTSSDRVHDPVFLSKTGTFVSVNSAASADLTGQVVSGAIGGIADFFEGAHLSGGGLRILALTSTTARGVPTIVAEHPAGAQVIIPRHCVDVVVTEHGVAWLRGRTLDERREALLRVSGNTRGDHS